jgi:hypothetical protein
MKVSGDDLVLTRLRAIDRFIRGRRRGEPPTSTLPRLLIVPIDGLSRLVFEQALASGRMSFVKMLERDGRRQEAMSVSLPTSTPAFRWMRSAGDLVIYGTDSPDGYVSFICEHGAHAGPGVSEMHTFIIRPAKVTLPLPTNHPVQLYDHFIRYQQT